MADVTLNLRLRTDARPEVLLKDLLLSPLIYIRLLGIVSARQGLFVREGKRWGALLARVALVPVCPLP